MNVESTLNLTRDQIMAELGAFAGYRRGSVLFDDKTWEPQKQRNLDTAVASGLRSFYYPPVLQGETQSHNWTFLKPVASVALASGESSLDLPDDFGGFEGPIVVAASGSSQRVPVTIRLVGEGQIRVWQESTPARTGSPLAAALTWLKGDGIQQSQRCRLTIYPESDQAYTLSFPYYFLPSVTSGTHPYALGGAMHAETILASCRAAFERHVDNLYGGPEHLNFLDRLAVSVSGDRRFAPKSLGPDRDFSDATDQRQDGTLHGCGVWGGITYMGTAI